MINLSKTKIFLPIVLIAAGAVAVIFLLLFPQMERITTAVSEIDKTRDNTLEIVNEVKSYEQSYQELAKLKRSSEFRIPIIFPKREDMKVLVQNLENAINRAGLSHTLNITDIKEKALKDPKAKDAKEPPKVIAGMKDTEEIGYTLNLAGDYAGLLNFLLYLENSEYLTEITKISAAADSLQNQDSEVLINTGTATMKIEGIFFVAKTK